jgi:hypothetical protein
VSRRLRYIYTGFMETGNLMMAVISSLPCVMKCSPALTWIWRFRRSGDHLRRPRFSPSVPPALPAVVRKQLPNMARLYLTDTLFLEVLLSCSRVRDSTLVRVSARATCSRSTLLAGQSCRSSSSLASNIHLPGTGKQRSHATGRSQLATKAGKTLS